MRSSPRGLALVLSNVRFDSRLNADLDVRRGGEVDEEVLRRLFMELDFTVILRKDLTAEVRQMQGSIRLFHEPKLYIC